MPKRVIFSDLHFGDPKCALRREAVAKSLRDFLKKEGPFEDLVLAGDILDANISSLTTAIWGIRGKKLWPNR